MSRFRKHARACAIKAFTGLVLLTIASCAHSAPAWAVSQLQAWLAAYNKRDAAAIGSFYSPDAVLRPFGKAPIRGRPDIVKHYRDGLAAETAVCAGHFDGFKTAADVAVGWGHDVCSYPADRSRRQPYHARWMLIYERDPSGRWFIVQDIDEGGET